MLRLALLVLLLVAPPAAAAFGDPPFVIELDTAEQTVEPQSFAQFRATITSRSSEPIELVFEVAYSDAGANAVPIPPLTLGAEGERTARLEVVFTVQSPFRNGRIDETSRVTYVVTPHHPEEERIVGDPQQVELTVRTVGTYVPSTQLLGALLALGLAALVLRRRV